MNTADDINIDLAIEHSRQVIKFDIYGIEVMIEKLPDGSPKGQQPRRFAVVKAQAWPRKGPRFDHTFVLPVISVWVDPFNNDAVKLYLYLKHGMDGSTNLESLRLQKYLVETIKREGAIHYNKVSGNRMTITCDTTGTILRYGIQGDTYANQKAVNDWVKVPIFDTKAKALEALLTEAQKNVTIGGLDLINLNSVGDEFLEAMGFEKIVDEIGNSVPMWRGRVEQIASAGGSSSYYDRKTSENSNSFVDILQAALAEAA